MNKDFWDKMGVVGTFLSSTLIVVFTTVVTWHTSKLSNKIEEFKTGIDENKMINDLVKEISSDSNSNVKYDFVLLALERYLRNTSIDGLLKDRDRDMLVGFAQSMILDRKNYHKEITETDMNRILIPKKFLEKYDSVGLNEIQVILANEHNKYNYPSDTVKINNHDLSSVAPVAQLNENTSRNSLNLILKKVVYIQYSDRVNQKKAEDILHLFKDNKWVAPGVEHVNGNFSNTIKYFHDEDRELANEANRILNNQYKVVANVVQKYRNMVPKGQIEIWISGN
jgi:hypothetical protein